MKHEDTNDVTGCAAVRVQLSAAHDGEARLGEALQRHLAQCAGCAAFAADLPSLGALFAPLRAAEPRPELRAALLARAQRTAPAPALLRPWALRAAAGAIGFLSVWALARARGEHAGGRELHALELLVGAGSAFESIERDIDSLPERALLAHVTATLGERR